LHRAARRDARRCLDETRTSERGSGVPQQQSGCAGTALRQGGGLAVLPRPLGDETPGILRMDVGENPPGRDTYVGYHRDLRRLTRMRALLDLVITRSAN